MLLCFLTCSSVTLTELNKRIKRKQKWLKRLDTKCVKSRAEAVQLAEAAERARCDARDEGHAAGLWLEELHDNQRIDASQGN